MIADFLEEEKIRYHWNRVTRRFHAFSSIQNQKEGSISWVRGKLPGNISVTCSHLVVPFGFERRLKNVAVIQVEDPRSVFGKILQRFFSREAVQNVVSPLSFIHESVRIGKNCFIDHFVSIAEGCRVGDNVKIHANVTLYDHVTLGDHVMIHSGAVIGRDGFGYMRDKDGGFTKMPQLGGVTIEPHVEIGANTCIDRGTLDDTVIGRGTKIDNLCHIAHNAVIGSNCIIIAHAEISGSVVIGKNVWIAPCVTLKEGIKIGDNSFVGFKSLVLKDIPSDALAYGRPATVRGRNKSKASNS